MLLLQLLRKKLVLKNIITVNTIKLKMKKTLLVVVILLIINAAVFAGCAQQQISTAENWEEKQQEEELEQVLEDSIPWSEAKNHIGQRITVYGPVVSTFYHKEGKGRPTFLNIGNPHPNPDRFTIVIWGDKRANFTQAPETYYSNKTIYVHGLIEEYKGVPQIIVDSPDQIKE